MADPEAGPAAATAAWPGAAELEGYLGADVVLDTAGPLLYLGRLERAGASFFVLRDADVHDTARGATHKERYLLEARRSGLRKNRDEVLVRTSEIVSLSRLDAITLY